MEKITNFATNIIIHLVSSTMKAKPNYPNDIFNLSNPEIFLDDIISYEQGKCRSLSNFEVDFSDSVDTPVKLTTPGRCKVTTLRQSN